jgi:amino-acid N-acetyltransferase
VSTPIRQAEPRELPDVLGLLKECGLPPDGVEENLDSFLVARESQTLLGTVGLECYGDAGLLRSLAVVPGRRGRRLGARLVEAVLGRAKENGIRTIYLLTDTATNFFPRFGFERIPREELDPRLGASQELQGACPETAVAMRLGLP